MKSLNKAQTPEDLKAWWEKCFTPRPSKGEVLITEKMDGISCFAGETPVHLANGETCTIQEIVENDLRPHVLTWSPETGETTERVIQVHNNGIRDNWVRLTLDDGSTVMVTDDHLFYVKGKGWVKAGDLLGEDILDLDDILDSND